MSYLTRTVLVGSSPEVRKMLGELGNALAPGGFAANERMRELAVELVRNSRLRVSALTYHDEPWELEVIPSGDPRCDLITLSRSESGMHCQLGWSRWIPLASKADISYAAGLITATFQAGTVIENREVKMYSDSNSDPRRYRQLAELFRADIKRGLYTPGEQLPSITDLCVKHGISRRTCGHAMKILETEKLIHRIPGLGYFVSGG